MIDKNLSQKIFGVLNITEDSFFDGGRYLSSKNAIEQTKKLIKQGAGVLDIGAASSHPDSKEVTPEQEIDRLKPILNFCKGEKIKISIDSYQPKVQVFAMEQGVDFLNDITGFSDNSIYEQLAKSKCKLIVMHSLQRKGKADRRKIENNFLEQIIEFFFQRIESLSSAGVVRERIILDTGMGFFLSSDLEVSFQVLQKIGEIKKIFQLPILLGISRKSFLQKALQKTANDISASGAYLEALLLEKGVDYIRTHDPSFLHDFFWLKKKLEAV